MHIHDFETFGLGSLFSQMPKSTDNTLRKAAGLVDALYTSDEEKLDRQAALARIISRGDALQTQLNTIEGSHRSLLVSLFSSCMWSNSSCCHWVAPVACRNLISHKWIQFCSGCSDWERSKAAGRA